MHPIHKLLMKLATSIAHTLNSILIYQEMNALPLFNHLTTL